MMNPRPLRSVTPAIDIYVRLAQYPILGREIRVRMRQDLFRRGIISEEEFDQLVEQRAIESQKREGLHDPFNQEDANIWQKRKERIRDFETDAYFAFNLGPTLLEQIITEVLASQPAPSDSIELTFNPEIAPWELLFRQGELYEQMTAKEQQHVKHHLQEIKVVLIKRMISDQLPYIGVAKKMFSIADLRRIYRRRIGSGKIGGKAAGLLLAWKILHLADVGTEHNLSANVDIPDSYFIGTEAIYEFRLENGLDHLMNQKYRPLTEIREEYPNIVASHLQGRFPQAIIDSLREVLVRFDGNPIIVRSSSLLEDNFGYAFAGKYNSYYCPNQGTDEENLQDLLQAVKRVFASTLNPDALLYRRKQGLIDYDERMAILIQRLEGTQYKQYFFPSLAGVAFSQNPFRWNHKIRREDGFLRLVWGFGTRAVDRVSNDYPRLIALSHPQLRPEMTAEAIRQYSQYFVDVVDLGENSFETLPIREVLNADLPDLRYIASINKGDYIQDILSTGSFLSDEQFVLTFDYLTRDKKFVNLMRTALRQLEEGYGLPVDVEFTVEIIANYPYPDYRLNIVQCRPLSQRQDDDDVNIPRNLDDNDILFRTHELIPDGKAEGIRYIVYIDPEIYRKTDIGIKHELGRAVSRVNRALEDIPYILMGPGRWGSVNIDLGVQVTYADIHNTKVLVEIAVAHNGQMPELSYGTHFFQDLVEAGIYSLPLHLGQENSLFNWAFFRESDNHLGQISPEDASLDPYLKIIDVPAAAGNRRLNILMDGHDDIAIGYLVEGDWLGDDSGQSTLSTF